MSAACFLAAVSLSAESLWEPGFKGYVTDTADIAVGDLVRVRVDVENSFSLNTIHTDSQELRFSFSGGEGSSLFSFLPQGSSGGSQEVEEEAEYELATGVVAEVVEERTPGRYLLRGSRSIEINGKREELVVEGEFLPGSLRNGEIRFSDLAGARLTYTAIGMGDELAIEEGDLIPPDRTAGEDETAGDAGEAPEAPQDGTASAATESSGTEQESGYRLTEEKKRELLRRYVSRIVDILFQY